MIERIAIIGAGYAGLSAGVLLSARGYCITVFEAGKTLGGRARAITYQGQTLDNGQHICLGAYTTLLSLLSQVDLYEETVFLRLPLELTLLPHFHLSLSQLPAPWHLFSVLWRTQGISLAERYRLCQLLLSLKRCHYHLPYDQPVAAWLRQQRQSMHLITSFWTPLCLAVLNTPIELASAQIFAYVLRDSLGKDTPHSDILLPTVDLSTAFPEAAARFIAQHNGILHLSRRIQSIQPHGTKWQVDNALFDQVIIAVAPHQIVHINLPTALAPTVSLLTQWPYHAIATVYLQYDPSIRLEKPMQGIAHGLSQWVFDRGYTHRQAGLIAVVISTMQKNIPHDQLVQQIRQELRQFFHIHAEPIWYKVIIEKRATFSATVNRKCPTQQTTMAGLWLAGDYTIDHYPATLESAVLSGKQIAQLIMESKHE